MKSPSGRGGALNSWKGRVMVRKTKKKKKGSKGKRKGASGKGRSYGATNPEEKIECKRNGSDAASRN